MADAIERMGAAVDDDRDDNELLWTHAVSRALRVADTLSTSCCLLHRIRGLLGEPLQ
jgi:hypothetical protein